MKKIISIIVFISLHVIINAQLLNSSYTTGPVGFASVDTLGQIGTNGGEGGDTITVSAGEELFGILDARRDSRFNENNPPLVILIEGKLTWGTQDMMDVKETFSVIDDNTQLMEMFMLVDGKEIKTMAIRFPRWCRPVPTTPLASSSSRWAGPPI